MGFPDKGCLLRSRGRRQSVERGQGRGNGRQEPMVKIDATKETLEIHLGFGLGYCPDGLDLGV